MRKSWLIAIILVLPTLYLCLEFVDALPLLRQTLIMPLRSFSFLALKILDIHTNGQLFRQLDVDASGYQSMLLRTLVFFIYTAVLVGPFWLWAHTRKPRYLQFGYALLVIYFLSSAGFMFLILLLMTHTWD